MVQSALFEIESVEPEREPRFKRVKVSAVQLELIFPETVRRVSFSNMDNTELAIFVRKNNNHAEAREALIQRNHNAIYAVANRTGLQGDDLEELANQLRWHMVRKTESAYKLHNVVRYEGWLLQVLRFKAIEIIRNQKQKNRGAVSMDEFEALESPKPSQRPSTAQEFWESLLQHERELLEWIGNRRKMNTKLRMTTVQKAVYDSVMSRGNEIFGN
jgi:hypothetical protein